MSETTDKTANKDLRPIIVWDDECRICNRLARKARVRFKPRGFVFVPLRVWRQMNPAATADEMRLVLPDGRDLGGVDAMLNLLSHLWWGRPFAWMGRWRSAHACMAAGYRWFAAHRYKLSCKDHCGGMRP